MSHTSNPNVRVNVRAARGSHVAVTVNLPGDATPRPQRLKFANGNSKLPQGVVIFSLPAGHTCPFAEACFARADRKTGRLVDGDAAEFRCFAASAEARWRTVREAHWWNLDQLRRCGTAEAMAGLILDSLSPFAMVVRVHESGDFFSQSYFDAWLRVAERRPQTTIYAYTKALPFWARRLDLVGNGHEPGTLRNVVLTASYGGRRDDLIGQLGLRSAKVFLAGSEAEGERMAAAEGLELDHDDGHAMTHGPSFGLLVHGMQRAGTPAAKAVAAQRAGGEFGYGERADEIRRERGLPSRPGR